MTLSKKYSVFDKIDECSSKGKVFLCYAHLWRIYKSTKYSCNALCDDRCNFRKSYFKMDLTTADVQAVFS